MPYCPECSASVPETAAECPTCGSALVATPTGAEEPEAPPSFDAAALEAELRDSLTPTYELLRLLGIGGMGAVFLAREPALKRLVAVKVLAPHLAAERTARARFEREATAAAALSHPNIVRVYSVGETASHGLPYIIMQYVEGATLAAWMGERDKVTERDARRIIGEVAAALAAAHQRDLVHRDVKPSNVLIETDTGRAYVADFGVSAALSPRQQQVQTKLTATGMVIGTPIYMSPEQAGGEAVTPKSDVYSLGILAYELTAHELPFTANSALGWITAHMRDTPTPLGTRRPDLPPEILKLVDRCLAKDAALRPGADEIARGMLPSLETEIAWPPPGLEDLRSRTRTIAQVLNFAAAGALMLLAAIAFTPGILQVHEHWLARFAVVEEVQGVTLRTRGSAVESGEVSFFAWQLSLMLGAGSFGLGVLLTAALGERLARRWWQVRRLGWHSTTLLDVAADPDGRGGLILVGAREFASLDAPTRKSVLRSRRLRLLFTIGMFLWVIAAVMLWLTWTLAGLGRPASPAPVAGIGSLLLAVVPALACGLGAALYRRREALLLGPLVRPQRLGTTQREVTEWYDAAPGKPPPDFVEHPRGSRRWVRPAGIVAVGIAVVALVLWAAAALLASLTAARFVQRVGPSTAVVARNIEHLARERPHLEARVSWDSLLPQTAPLPDSIARPLLRADYLPLYDPGHIRLYPNDSTLALAVARALRDSLPADTVRMLEGLDRHPRTAAFRRLALADSLDLWASALDRAVDQYPNAWAIPIVDMRQVRNAAHANTLSAVFALAQGRRRAVEQRVGETAAFAEKLVHEPIQLYNLHGLAILQREVVALLTALAAADGRAQDAARLRQAAGRLDAHRFPLRGIAGLAADPTQPGAYQRLLVEDGVWPGLKAELLVAGWGGLCASPREILGGPTQTRRRAMYQAAELSGIRYARETTFLADRIWSTPVGALATEEAFRDRGWLERTPYASILRLSMCSESWW
ncbi:MAG: protein kinase [Gemmatimonadetes bacterium]|nr:protein kinase [Gemmatimonadota bacterium]